MNSNPHRRVTLKDVARRAQLSIAAVSMALRDHPALPARTRERVKRLARALQYAPDPALSALAAHRNRLRVVSDYGVLALVSNWSTRDGWTKLASAGAAQAGAVKRARMLGYSVQHFWARDSGAAPARFGRILTARGIRGLILAPFEDPAGTLELDWEQFSVVAIERPSRYPEFHYVSSNYHANLQLAWEHLRRLGYRRVGLLVRDDIAERVAHQWEATQAFEQRRTGGEESLIPTLIVHPGREVPAIRRWLEQHRPQAVISRGDGFFAAAAEAGLRIPRDVGYVSLNVADDRPGASGIQQRRELIGATAVDVLNTLLQRNHRGRQMGLPGAPGTLVDGAWAKGATLARRGPARKA